MPPRPYSDRSVLPRDSSNSSVSVDSDAAEITVDTSPSSLSAATTPSPIERDIFMDFNTVLPEEQDEELDFKSSTIACYPTPADSMPFDHNFPDFIRQLTNEHNLANVHSLRLKVISRLVSLQRISLFTTNLRELDLDGSVLGSLRDIGCNLKHLQVLKVGNCQLDSLDGTFGLTSLRQLYAQGNLITDVSPCSNLPHIQHIDVSHNRIRNIAYAGFLSVCRKLKTIVFTGNPATEVPDYRNYVRKIIPQLQSLDDTPFTNQENEEFDKYIGKREMVDDLNEINDHDQLDFYNNSFDSDELCSATNRSTILESQLRTLQDYEINDFDIQGAPINANGNLHGREFSLLSLRRERDNIKTEAKKGMNINTEETEDLMENTRTFSPPQAGRSDDALMLPPLNINDRESKKTVQESLNFAISNKSEKLKLKLGERSSSMNIDASNSHGYDSKAGRQMTLKRQNRPNTASSSIPANDLQKWDDSPQRRPCTAGFEQIPCDSRDLETGFKIQAGGLTSGLPICGNLAVALRNRKKQQERKDVDMFQQDDLEKLNCN